MRSAAAAADRPSEAARLRRLAAEATTPRMKQRLAELAEQSARRDGDVTID
jgi:hypothetical protein